jgi:hypothetical protein
MQREKVERRYPMFRIRPSFIGAIIGAIIWDYTHPGNHFLVSALVCVLVFAIEAGTALANALFPQSTIARVLILIAAGVSAVGAWYLFVGRLSQG